MPIPHFGLTGYHLRHSLSPKIHAAALKACGLQGDYALYPIPPADTLGLKTLFARVRNGEICGLNVTIPHKQAVIEYLDELTPSAHSIGAVNTIYLRDSKLTGDNTDTPGFLTDLKRFIGERGFEIINRQSSIVFGAGGAARAVVYALINNGWDVTVSARRLEQAQAFAAHFGIRAINLFDLQPTALDLIVNATPLGMFPNTDTSPWPAGLPFPSGAAVYDLVYNPRETRLVREARAARLPATTGLGMLVEQAALSFERWTGCSPPRDALLDAVR